MAPVAYPAERFARRVFFWAGVYGVAVLLPHYFLEHQVGQAFPPAITHPENFYGFIGVALVWQLAFLAIARQPVRLSPLMPIAALEKFLPSVSVFLLALAGRTPWQMALFAVLDTLIGCLFVASFLRLRGASAARAL